MGKFEDLKRPNLIFWQEVIVITSKQVDPASLLSFDFRVHKLFGIGRTSRRESSGSPKLRKRKLEKYIAPSERILVLLEISRNQKAYPVPKYSTKTMQSKLHIADNLCINDSISKEETSVSIRRQRRTCRRLQDK